MLVDTAHCLTVNMYTVNHKKRDILFLIITGQFLVMARYIASYRISRYGGHIVAYLYRDIYPSDDIDIPHHHECCRQHIALSAIGDVDKGSLAERGE